MSLQNIAEFKLLKKILTKFHYKDNPRYKLDIVDIYTNEGRKEVYNNAKQIFRAIRQYPNKDQDTHYKKHFGFTKKEFKKEFENEWEKYKKSNPKNIQTNISEGRFFNTLDVYLELDTKDPEIILNTFEILDNSCYDKPSSNCVLAYSNKINKEMIEASIEIEKLPWIIYDNKKFLKLFKIDYNYPIRFSCNGNIYIKLKQNKAIIEESPFKLTQKLFCMKKLDDKWTKLYKSIHEIPKLGINKKSKSKSKLSLEYVK